MVRTQPALLTVSTKIHNLLLGNPWLEHYGDLEVKNLTTGDTATIKFKQGNAILLMLIFLAGLFEGVQKKIGGFVVSKDGKKWYDTQQLF